jgi:hypothetical protein
VLDMAEAMAAIVNSSMNFVWRMLFAKLALACGGTSAVSCSAD